MGCSYKNSNVVEAWVRVVGLPLHFWSLEVIKESEMGVEDLLQWMKIPDPCLS